MPTATVFGPFSPELAPARATPSRCASRFSRASASRSIADEASREVAASLAAALEAVGARTRAHSHRGDRGASADAGAAGRSSTRSSAPTPASSASSRCRGSSALAHGHRRHRRAPADPLRAHGRRHARDHDAGHARRLPAGRSPQHDGCASACGRRTTLRVETAAGTSLTATFDPVARTGSRPAASSARATGPTCRPARCSRRRPRSTATFVCNGTAGDYFGPQVRRPRADAADAGDRRAGGSSPRTAIAPGAGARVLGLLPHRREQRSRRRAGLRHQPRPRAT